jgi:histidine triad (HIT) family protein
MSSCIFCRIAAGELPSAELLDDERVYAFLDINPLRAGHALLVPKRHAAKLEEVPDADAAALMRATQRVTTALCKATGATDATIAINDGPAAGQEVPHLHIHIVPRRPGDGAGPIHDLFKHNRPRPSPEDLNDLAVRVQGLLAAATAPGGGH